MSASKAPEIGAWNAQLTEFAALKISFSAPLDQITLSAPSTVICADHP